ncbi:MAG: cell wall hydrolase [Lachnospiraceae bacterium]|nr:cell wall hydrolase [Lachnospiraceae bacterium]
MTLKQRKRADRLYIGFILVLLFISGFGMRALATEDTKEKMEQAEKERDKKQAELEEARDDLAQTRANLTVLQLQKNSYQGKMKLLNENLQEVADNLSVLEAEIDLKQMEIDRKQMELDQSRQDAYDQYESMKARIRFLYEGGSATYGELLISAGSFGEMLNYADYIQDISYYDRRKLDEFVETSDRVQKEERELQAEMDELDTLKMGVLEEQKRVTGLIDETANSIAKTAESIEDTKEEAEAYEKEVQEAADAAAAANAEYEKIKVKYEEELRLSRLAKEAAWRDITEVTFEEGDRMLLANLIYCEAGGEPYEGQLAVGAVVINRVLSSVYPDTVTGVIYQRGQFSPVSDGHLALALASDKATDSCYQAADAAMSGRTNVGNCVYFRTPIPGLEGIRIGGHIFY